MVHGTPTTMLHIHYIIYEAATFFRRLTVKRPVSCKTNKIMNLRVLHDMYSIMVYFMDLDFMDQLNKHEVSQCVLHGLNVLVSHHRTTLLHFNEQFAFFNIYVHNRNKHKLRTRQVNLFTSNCKKDRFNKCITCALRRRHETCDGNLLIFQFFAENSAQNFPLLKLDDC